MNLFVCGLLVVAWWFVLWELATILTEDLTRDQKIYLYTPLFLVLTLLVLLYPKYLRVA